MRTILLGAIAALSTCFAFAAPVPLLNARTPVDWWMAFKFDGTVFPGCAAKARAHACLFGGHPQSYERDWSQQFVYASSANPNLAGSSDCLGTTTDDPVGATFSPIYNGNNYYVVWNDQFYNNPPISGCGDSCSAPAWAHSKGILSWNKSGTGVVMQVTTPSWPASGSARHPRRSDGNTLGCVEVNNVNYSQHFFALRLNHQDVVAVLKAMLTARVVTNIHNPQIVNSGGPSDIQHLVAQLGAKNSVHTLFSVPLSTGIVIIAKPAALAVPPWQMVSATLGGVPLRVASWWQGGKPSTISSTTANTKIDCWDPSLQAPGAVEIASTGSWKNQTFALTGGNNHAKIGVSTDPKKPFTIFGDMNQQGALRGNCKLSQNGRGGLFFAISNPALAQSMSKLISGSATPTR